MERKGNKRVRVAITDFFLKKSKTADDTSSSASVPQPGDGNGERQENPETTPTRPSQSVQSNPVADGDSNGGSGDSCLPTPDNRTSCTGTSDCGSPSSSTAPSALRSEPVVALNLDIGAHVGKVDQLSDHHKTQLLQTPWTPDEKYKFPFSEHMKNNKQIKRYVGRQHLASHHWLTLSDIHQGLYCKYCVLFAAKFVSRSSESPGVFVKRPLKTFAKLCGKDGALASHEAKEYHKQSVTFGKNFLSTYFAPELEVINQVNAQRLAQVKENRARLRPIVETIVFCGRQNIALRGHRDDGILLDTCSNASGATSGTTIDKYESSSSIVANDGNFRALLRFRVTAGDTVLENHLRTAKSNATYISKTIQNDLIECCGKEIVDTISQRVQQAGCYSIIFDETTDASHKEQMSISLRYLHKGSVREDFIAFTDCYEAIEESDIEMENEERRLTGKALAAIAVKACAANSVDMKKCVGAGTDNCMVMASVVKGAVKELQKLAPMLVRCPCLNHTLNNSLKKTNTNNACRSSNSKMKETIAFSRSSAKIFKVFKDTLGKAFCGLCETRWQEQHDGVIQFEENLPKICEALEVISKWSSPETSSKAYSLLNGLCDSEFIISTVVLSDVLGTTRPLSKMLQSPTLDHQAASNAVKDTLAVLEKKRQFVDNNFKALCQKALNTAEELNVELLPPRMAQRQTKRDNHPAANAEEFFRRSIFIPVLDGVLSDLKNRLSEEVLNSFDLRLLLPFASMEQNDKTDNYATEDEDELHEDQDVISKLNRLSEFYEDLLGPRSSSRLVAEYELWQERWQRIQREGGEIPTKVLDVIEHCDSDMFPNIRQLLVVLATLPVSVATAERSFSTLRRLKTWLRTRMSEERLNGLALLNIHYDIECSVEKVIDRFVKERSRRLDFVI